MRIKQIGRFGKYRSRKGYRAKFRKTPGGRTVVHFEKRRPKPARCASCGKVLYGTARERAYKMRNTPKTKRRPERPYGGYFCSRCARKKLLKKLEVRRND